MIVYYKLILVAYPNHSFLEAEELHASGPLCLF
jgi:hypothetical protein